MAYRKHWQKAEKLTHHLLQWEQLLNSRGHRVTRQRELILDAVCDGEGHTPFGEIYERVQRADSSIDRSTVYRALHLFVEIGLVVVADIGGDETFYEIARQQPHHHLVCQHCGTEKEISDAALEGMFNEVFQQHNFRIETDHLVLFGTCDECQENRNR